MFSTRERDQEATWNAFRWSLGKVILTGQFEMQSVDAFVENPIPTSAHSQLMDRKGLPWGASAHIFSDVWFFSQTLAIPQPYMFKPQTHLVDSCTAGKQVNISLSTFLKLSLGVMVRFSYKGRSLNILSYSEVRFPLCSELCHNLIPFSLTSSIIQETKGQGQVHRIIVNPLFLFQDLGQHD